ncbi:MAG: hypothetical protein QOJ29_1704 [Thermoleophilaceae bacterium]|nr:hypothetical protein [Thermoleophilaceae bacterium]
MDALTDQQTTTDYHQTAATCDAHAAFAPSANADTPGADSSRAPGAPW